MSGIEYNRLNGPQRKILRETLASAFRRSDLDMFLEENGFEPLDDVVAPGPFTHQVFELIRVLTKRGRLDDLVTRVVRQYPENPAVIDLDQRLRFADDEASSQRVVVASGLERWVRKAGFQDLDVWARRLVELGRRVCHLRYPVPEGTVGGTGFLVAADLVLTNFHVIEALLDGDTEPETVEVDFGYAVTDAGLSPGERFRLAEEWLVAKAPYSEADLAPNAGVPGESELDFALLRLAAPAGEAQVAGEPRGAIDLGSAGDPTRGDEIVFVLQHPNDQPLKQSIGLLRPQVTPLRLRYDADTLPGSSGGLVLDPRLHPVALHHAGDPTAKLQAEYNQGIPLPLIRAALEADAAVPRFW